MESEAGEADQGTGPGCGWAVCYIELLMKEYGFSLAQVLGRDPRNTLLLDAGLALLEARRERKQPGSTVSCYIRAVARARDAVRQWYEERYELLPHAEYLARTSPTPSHG